MGGKLQDSPPLVAQPLWAARTHLRRKGEGEGGPPGVIGRPGSLC